MSFNWIVFLCLAGGTLACDGPGKPANTEGSPDHAIAVYHQAMKVGDFTTAIGAIHSALAMDEGNWRYYDTLSILYFRNNQYPQAALSAQEILAHDTGNIKMLNVAARSFEMLDMQDSALHYFTRLRSVDKNPEYGYQIAMTQFKLDRYAESRASAMEVVSDSRADTMQMIVSMSNSEEQIVPLKAAAYNLLGTLSHTEKKTDEAKEDFKKALSIYPDFILVKNNLERVMNKE